MDEKLQKLLVEKLNVLIRIDASILTKGMKISEAAPLLYQFGLTQVEIASILGSTTSAVNTRIAEAKAGKKKIAKNK